MYELDHPHVMKFREWYETTNHLWLVMDLCDGNDTGKAQSLSSWVFFATGGSLKSIIQADGSLPEISIRSIGANICQGLHYLHQQEIIFCDLNPDKVREEFCLLSLQYLRVDRFGWFECIQISKYDVVENEGGKFTSNIR